MYNNLHFNVLFNSLYLIKNKQNKTFIFCFLNDDHGGGGDGDFALSFYQGFPSTSQGTQHTTSFDPLPT